jgi:hypothetical protein
VIEPPADPIEQEWLVSAVRRFFVALPADLAFVALLALREDGDVGEAQRQSGLSIAEFYRRLRETRCRMICVGIVRRPPSLGTAPGGPLGKKSPLDRY